MKIVSVAVAVSDPKKAKAWFTEMLGFRLVDDDGDHWVTVAPEGANVALHLCQSSPLEPGNAGSGFTAKDVEADATELPKRGVKFSQPAKKLPWGTLAKFLDPDGNEFRLVSE